MKKIDVLLTMAFFCCGCSTVPYRESILNKVPVDDGTVVYMAQLELLNH